MKADFIERFALVNGWFGYWFFILVSTTIGFMGGLTLGAIAAGILSGIRKVEFESDQVSAWVIGFCALLGAFLTGRWCRRRLTNLKNEETEQVGAGDAEEAV